MTGKYLSAMWSPIALAMGNHLWQSTLFAAGAAVLVFVLRDNQARARYWLWLAASVKFLIPFSLLVAIGRHVTWPHASPQGNAGLYFTIEEIERPFTLQTTSVTSPKAFTAVGTGLAHLLPALVATVWLCGFVVVLFKWSVRWRRVSAAMREAVLLREGREVETLRRLEGIRAVRKPIDLFRSQDCLEPGVFGIVRPVLIWPDGISERLEDAHLEAILAHELCHVRRRDNLAAAVHMAVGAMKKCYRCANNRRSMRRAF